MTTIAPSVTITDERVDDIPLLIHTMAHQLGFPTLLDDIWPRHGNWLGLSLGHVMVTWLAHILSECTHTMSPVRDWANDRRHTLACLLGQELRETDLSDDRLAEVLRILGRDAVWHPLEQAVTQRTIRVYRLPQGRVRLDTTTASIHSGNGASVLFQRGHSKDHRPDLPQLKAMLATLDPLGLLVAVDVVAGQRADDGLYVPLIDRLRTVLDAKGLLYIGDCKMSALATRAYLQATHNYYLMPLAQVGTLPAEMEAWITVAMAGQVRLTTIVDTDGQTVLGEGYELSRSQHGDGPTGPLRWTERVLVVRSEAFAAAAQRGLRQRLNKAQAALEALTPPPGRGRRQFTETAPLREAVQAILTQYKVEGLLTIDLQRKTHQRSVRAYGDRPARVEKYPRYVVHVQRGTPAIERLERTLGWRVYATNTLRRALTLTQAVQAYRDEYLVERNFARLKGRPLSLTPLWLTREDHAIGLVRLLTLAARVLALVEYQVRQQLANTQRTFVGLYPGQATRATDQPTTERLLLAFKHITLIIIRKGNKIERHITPLSNLQKSIIKLLGYPRDLYDRLTMDFG
jgi:transposase